MLDALLAAGVKYVIGGDGRNWAGERSVYGASLLGLWFRRLFTRGLDPLRALALAKKRVRADMAVSRFWEWFDKRPYLPGQVRRAEAARDTLGFRAYYRR